jgi:hypothetical protein
MAVCAVALVGCFDEPDYSDHNDNDNNNNGNTEPLEVPSVSSISSQTLRVGDPVNLSGENFVDDDRGKTQFIFRGTYYRSDGNEEQVDFTVEDVDIMNPNEASWKFGPYDVPFCQSGDQTGTFWGEIQAVTVPYEGTELVQNGSLNVELQVLPSIVVRSFQPTMADCLRRSDVILDHIPYKLEVVAVGFTPKNFTYTISEGALMSPNAEDQAYEEPFEIQHTVSGKVDKLGEQEYLNFAPVPYGLHGYDTWIKVEAEALGGEQYSYLMPLTVRHPLVARYAGRVEVAQIYEAVPVSGCIYGDETGRTVQYTETHEEVREREYGTTLTAGWEHSYTQSHTDTYGEGGSQANTIGFSTTDGVSFGWNMNTEVSGSVGIDAIAKVGVSVGMGVSFEQRHEETQSGSYTEEANWNWSQAVSQSETASQTVEQSGTEVMRVRSSNSESLNFSAELLPMKYGVFYRQTTRLVRRIEVVAYDLCGNWTEVGTMHLSDYTWAPDLAMGDSCPPFPESNLSSAQCFISPCE